MIFHILMSPDSRRIICSHLCSVNSETFYKVCKSLVLKGLVIFNSDTILNIGFSNSCFHNKLYSKTDDKSGSVT